MVSDLWHLLGMRDGAPAPARRLLVHFSAIERAASVRLRVRGAPRDVAAGWNAETVRRRQRRLDRANESLESALAEG